jgi:hypothetical protein
MMTGKERECYFCSLYFFTTTKENLMKTWYSCKIKHTKENEEGILKQVTEAYLVDAVNYTEAESRIYEIAQEITHGEFFITQITKTNITELVKFTEDDDWFKSKITYLAADDDSGKEKKINVYLLVCAKNVGEAFEHINRYLSGMLVPYEVPSISRSNIIEVFPFQSEQAAVSVNSDTEND